MILQLTNLDTHEANVPESNAVVEKQVWRSPLSSSHTKP